jgi:hypothetical protein
MFFPFLNFPISFNRLQAVDARRFPSFLYHGEFASVSAISMFAAPALELSTSIRVVGEAARKTRVSKRTDSSRSGGIRHRQEPNRYGGRRIFLRIWRKIPSPLITASVFTDTFIMNTLISNRGSACDGGRLRHQRRTCCPRGTATLLRGYPSDGDRRV